MVRKSALKKVVVLVFFTFSAALAAMLISDVRAASETRTDVPTVTPSEFKVSIHCSEALWPDCVILLQNRGTVTLSAKTVLSFSSYDEELFKGKKITRSDVSFEWQADRGSFVSKSAEQATWEAGPGTGIATITVTARISLLSTEKKPWPWQAKPQPLEYQTSAKTYLAIPSTYEEASADQENKVEIGRYPVPHSSNPEHYLNIHPDKYQIPKAFYKISQRDADLHVSPHFTLGDFDMNFPYFHNGFPQYVPLSPRIVQKLETVLEAMNKEGFQIPTFTLISGFRPPAYNRGAIKNGADLKKPFSRHQYGDAVDLIIDENPKDGAMDDLNRDGKIDIKDAEIIEKYVDKLDAILMKEKSPLLGGAGVYSRHDIFERSPQSPYIHIDTRGFASQHGQPVRWREAE